MVGNPDILVNLVSRRVRQLNSGGGSISQPLILTGGTLGAADTALTELVEGKMGWELLTPVQEELVVPKKRKKS